MKKIFVLIFIYICSNLIAQSGFNHNLDSVVVTAHRIPVIFSEIGKSIDIISRNDIQLLPATNIQDMLEFTNGLDIKQRGPGGVQGDISFRGTSFEQSLILIDGIKLSDPQTGHHKLNLPVSLSQIEKVEILKGQGTRLYGANAFGGVINLILKNEFRNNVSLSLSGGENDYYNIGLNSTFAVGATSHNVSFERKKSDGYRHNTEFDNLTLSMNNSFNFESMVIKSILGYTHKDFGANSYYTTKFPNQSEETKTILSAISADIELSNFRIAPKVYWRNNKDEFLLEKHNPSFYKNNHETNVYGTELQISTSVLGGNSSIGIEYSKDEIVSNNLGEHTRDMTGFFLEQRTKPFENLTLSIGGFAYYYSEINWKFWPGIDISFNPIKELKVYGNYGRAFRIPTYTELFYSDPVTKGNSGLKPEESDNFELGINWRINNITFDAAMFRRESKNLIDYVYSSINEIWEAENYTMINTNGFETSVQLNLGELVNKNLYSLKIGYTYIDSDKKDLELESRYNLEYLKHDLSIILYHKLPFGINQSWTLNYEDRLTLDDYITLDTKLNRNFNNFNIFLNVSNLFNKTYEEIPGVILPGRWIIAGINLTII